MHVENLCLTGFSIQRALPPGLSSAQLGVSNDERRIGMEQVIIGHAGVPFVAAMTSFRHVSSPFLSQPGETPDELRANGHSAEVFIPAILRGCFLRRPSAPTSARARDLKCPESIRMGWPAVEPMPSRQHQTEFHCRLCVDDGQNLDHSSSFNVPHHSSRNVIVS